MIEEALWRHDCSTHNMNSIYDAEVTQGLSRFSENRTMGKGKKTRVEIFQEDICFFLRIVNKWNKLPAYVNTKFWGNLEYDKQLKTREKLAWKHSTQIQIDTLTRDSGGSINNVVITKPDRQNQATNQTTSNDVSWTMDPEVDSTKHHWEWPWKIMNN